MVFGNMSITATIFMRMQSESYCIFTLSPDWGVLAALPEFFGADSCCYAVEIVFNMDDISILDLSDWELSNAAVFRQSGRGDVQS